jgi:hypothetical protein
VLDPAAHGRLDEGARFDGVVEVVAERVGDGLRHHDLGGEMRDRLDAVLADDAADEVLVAHVADDELRLGRQGPVESGRQVVEDDDLLAGVEESQNHVAADVSRRRPSPRPPCPDHPPRARPW